MVVDKIILKKHTNQNSNKTLKRITSIILGHRKKLGEKIRLIKSNLSLGRFAFKLPGIVARTKGTIKQSLRNNKDLHSLKTHETLSLGVQDVGNHSVQTA